MGFLVLLLNLITTKSKIAIKAILSQSKKSVIKWLKEEIFKVLSKIYKQLWNFLGKYCKINKVCNLILVDQSKSLV